MADKKRKEIEPMPAKKEKPKTEPTKAELRILKCLWSAGEPMRLREIIDALRPEGDFAPSTVATMLKVMSQKGFVQRVMKDGRAMWRAESTRAASSKLSLQNLIDRLFEGSPRKLVSHLIDSGELSASDRRELKALLDHPSSGNEDEPSRKKGR